MGCNSSGAAGNMAGESQEVRQRLRANGAVRPLLQLVLAAKGQSGLRVLSTACTAAWALSNLLQDSDAMLSPDTRLFHLWKGCDDDFSFASKGQTGVCSTCLYELCTTSLTGPQSAGHGTLW